MKIIYETGKISALGEMRSLGTLRYYEFLELEQDGGVTRLENLLMTTMATPKIEYGDTATIAFQNGNFGVRGERQIFRNRLLGYATDSQFAVGRGTREAVIKEMQVLLLVGIGLLLWALYLSNPWSLLICVFALPFIGVSCLSMMKFGADNALLERVRKGLLTRGYVDRTAKVYN